MTLSETDSSRPIKVLIVEDSPVARELLIYILSSDPQIEVMGVARNGHEALSAVRQQRPDVITMDIHMPGMDGFETTREIMRTYPTPIVIVSASTSTKDVSSTFRALEAGALAQIIRPPGMGHPEHETSARELVETVKLMSEVKVVRRIDHSARREIPRPIVESSLRPAAQIQVAAIGASTGGPPVLQKILSGLPYDLSFPVLIVQHIAPGFVNGFAEWLAGSSGFPVQIASHGLHPLPGHGYVAPDGFHMGVGHGPRIVLSDEASENGLRPSVAYLFRSVTRVLGPAAIGVLLSGMGTDGVTELKALRQTGAITIAQDKESAVVFGMPGEAVKQEAAAYVLAPDEIVKLLASLTKQTKGGNA